MATPFRILSIDGGGTRGVIPATILDCVYQATGKHPVELFDLFAGTSTGGIICIGLTYGIEPAVLVDLYLNKSGDVFYDTGFDDLRDGFGKNLGADYSNKRLKANLEHIFHNATLETVHQKLAEHGSDKSLMVCSFSLDPDKEGQPINFRPAIYHSNFICDKNIKLVDLALRTSAGPTYFPIYQNHIDGGVSINHPAMAAVAFAINKNKDDHGQYCYMDGTNKGLNKDLKDLKVMSLGTGTSNRNRIDATQIKEKRNGDWGNLQWIEFLPDLLTESNVQASDYYVQQVLKEGGDDKQYHRIQLEFDAIEAPALIQKEIEKGKVLGLDVKNKALLQAMHEYAIQYYQQHEEEILSFLNVEKKAVPV